MSGLTKGIVSIVEPAAIRRQGVNASSAIRRASPFFQPSARQANLTPASLPGTELDEVICLAEPPDQVGKVKMISRAIRLL